MRALRGPPSVVGIVGLLSLASGVVSVYLIVSAFRDSIVQGLLSLLLSAASPDALDVLRRASPRRKPARRAAASSCDESEGQPLAGLRTAL